MKNQTWHYKKSLIKITKNPYFKDLTSTKTLHSTYFKQKYMDLTWMLSDIDNPICISQKRSTLVGTRAVLTFLMASSKFSSSSGTNSALRRIPGNTHTKVKDQRRTLSFFTSLDTETIYVKYQG